MRRRTQKPFNRVLHDVSAGETKAPSKEASSIYRSYLSGCVIIEMKRWMPPCKALRIKNVTKRRHLLASSETCAIKEENVIFIKTESFSFIHIPIPIDATAGMKTKESTVFCVRFSFRPFFVHHRVVNYLFTALIGQLYRPRVLSSNGRVLYECMINSALGRFFSCGRSTRTNLFFEGISHQTFPIITTTLIKRYCFLSVVLPLAAITRT